MSTRLEQRLYMALRHISQFEMPDRLRKRAERDYGLEPEELFEMAYENVILAAKRAIKGVRVKIEPDITTSRTEK